MELRTIKLKLLMKKKMSNLAILQKASVKLEYFARIFMKINS